MADPNERTVDLHEEADRELTEAVRWYAAESPQAADRFITAMDAALRRIGEGPSRWPPYSHGTRRYLLRRFPYQVVYREHLTDVQVIAVMHLHRKPGYWRGRL